MIIFLIGYMGSGKSTIGLKLSHSLQFEYIDLDDYIEDMEGMSVSELFKSKGEIYFRKKETHYLHLLLSSKNTVISLGGGTPCYASNMEMIVTASGARSIYLKASIGVLVERLFSERTKRPLISHLQTKEELTEFIGKHLFERSYFYSQADSVVSVDEKNVDQIVEELELKLG